MRNYKLVAASACLAALAAALIAALPAGAGSLTVDQYTYSTATGEIHVDDPNQGWWSLEDTSTTGNVDYIAGRDGGGPGTAHFRNFFTFDIAGTTTAAPPRSTTSCST